MLDLIDFLTYLGFEYDIDDGWSLKGHKKIHAHIGTKNGADYIGLSRNGKEYKSIDRYWFDRIDSIEAMQAKVMEKLIDWIS